MSFEPWLRGRPRNIHKKRGHGLTPALLFGPEHAGVKTPSPFYDPVTNGVKTETPFHGPVISWVITPAPFYDHVPSGVMGPEKIDCPRTGSRPRKNILTPAPAGLTGVFTQAGSNGVNFVITPSREYLALIPRRCYRLLPIEV